jgi:hypothetical protein
MQKGVDKDVHLVVDFLESRECHGNALYEKGINPLWCLKDPMMFDEEKLQF